MNSGAYLSGSGNHQVNVEFEACSFADGLDYRDSDADVGDEVAVHDVDMEERSSGALDLGDFFTQVRKISREDGGEYFDHA